MEKPNILLITTDQQHFSTLGMVNEKIQTPNLDRLCRMGTRFDRGYCASPVCTPSRASILTGKLPSEHQAWTIGVQLPEKTRTVAELLSNVGYQTGLIGKAHFQPLADSPTEKSVEKHPNVRDLDFWRKFNGPWYGFDHIEITRNHADEAMVGQHYGAWMEDKGLDNWRDFFQPAPGETSEFAIGASTGQKYWKRSQLSWPLQEEFHYTTWTGERSRSFIEKAAKEEQPFFLWTSFHDPHPPYLVSEPWASMYNADDMEPGTVAGNEHDSNPPHFQKTQEETPDFGDWHSPFGAPGCHSHLDSRTELKKEQAAYYGMVSFLDKEIGRILDCLEAHHQLKNTLIVFTSDHGHFLGQHGLIAKGPFHYEDLLRVPFIVSWPDKLPKNRVSTTLQTLLDLAPTFLEAAGNDVPNDMQGNSRLSEWTGESSKSREFVLCENRHNPVMPCAITMIDRRYKITVYQEGEFGELFDLSEDPGEVQNLWNDQDYLELKNDLLRKFIQARLASELMKMPRVSHA